MIDCLIAQMGAVKSGDVSGIAFQSNHFLKADSSRGDGGQHRTRAGQDVGRDGGGLFASHGTAVFDLAERGPAALWRPTEASGASGIGLSQLRSQVQSRSLLTTVVSRQAYGKCRLEPVRFGSPTVLHSAKH